MEDNDWAKAMQPLLDKYRGKKHPLDYKNIYQLLVMVVLSAQDSDANINKLAPAFFEKYPDMKALAKANTAELSEALAKVRFMPIRLPGCRKLLLRLKRIRTSRQP